MVLGPLVAMGMWGVAFTAVFVGLGLDAPCAFDPPPGDHFLVSLVNDTASDVEVEPSTFAGSRLTLRPGQHERSLTGSCGGELQVYTPGHQLLGCLDESSQDTDTPPPLRVSRVGHCTP